jgi:poly-gamma-glutamate capsule biosynthesis protein CapA/YwtB (metallophosphatase superfamily)
VRIILLLSVCFLHFISFAAASDKTAVLTAVGDVVLYDPPIAQIYKIVEKQHPGKPDAIHNFPFQYVRHLFQGIVICNLEAPLTDLPAKTFADKNEPFYFQVPAHYVESLKQGGFTSVCLANNHMKDCGVEGIADTLKNLDKAGLGHLGAGQDSRAARKPLLTWRNGVKIALLNYDLVPPSSVWAGAKRPGTAHTNLKGMIADIANAKKIASSVVVILHWGREIYRETNIRPPMDRRKLAHALVDAGASAVLGAHSHAVESVEKYKDGVIFYGLGNFVFGSSFKNLHPYSIIARLTFGEKGLLNYEIIPVDILPPRVEFSPRELKGQERQTFLKRITEKLKD